MINHHYFLFKNVGRSGEDECSNYTYFARIIRFRPETIIKTSDINHCLEHKLERLHMLLFGVLAGKGERFIPVHKNFISFYVVKNIR